EQDGAEISASELRDRNLANADHLSILNAIWQGETEGLRNERYRQIVEDALPTAFVEDLRPTSKWLYRTLRMAEAAGLDVTDVVTAAVDARPLTGARDVAAVIDSRIRQRVYPLVPLPPKPWREQVPEVADPDMQRFLTDLAAAMD